MSRFRVLGGVGLAMLVVGCGGSGETEVGAPEGVNVETTASGRVIVTNPRPTWTEATAWSVEEDLRIGTLAGDGPDQFGQISAIKADPDGRIYVLDYMSQDIRVFNPDGSHAHTIGKPGEGPGELMRAAGLNWGPDGNLWVWDPGGRFSIFTADGTFVDSHQRRVRGVVYPWRGDFDVDGSLVDWGLTYPGIEENGGTPGWAPSKIIYYPVRFSGDFTEGDSVPRLEFDFELNAEGERLVFGEGMSSYQDREGTIWFAYNKRFTLYRRTLDGDTVLQTTIDATPAAVTSAEVDSVRSIYIDQGRADRAPDFDQFADDKPMIRRIFGDNLGHVFVAGEQEGLPLGTFLDVFQDDGVYLGRLDLPTPVNFPYPPPFASDTHLYYVTKDDFDVEYVVRMRLSKPGPS